MPAGGWSDPYELWEQYKRTGDIALRNQLVTHYLPLVRKVARSIPVGDYDDLCSEGVVGLLDAIERFDLDQGVKFATYAMSRIHGAIVDWLRETDWAPRLVRRRAREIAAASERLARRLGRTPSHAELAAEAGMTLDQFDAAVHLSNAAQVVSIDVLMAGYDGGPWWQPRCEELGYARVEAPLVIADCLLALNRQQRYVIDQYFYAEQSLADIGEDLGVTESRVCQIKSEALRRMRERAELPAQPA